MVYVDVDVKIEVEIFVEVHIDVYVDLHVDLVIAVPVTVIVDVTVGQPTRSFLETCSPYTKRGVSITNVRTDKSNCILNTRMRVDILWLPKYFNTCID